MLGLTLTQLLGCQSAEVMADLLPDAHDVSDMQLSKCEFCAAMYDGSWYIDLL
jgi:hypothetical protein